MGYRRDANSSRPRWLLKPGPVLVLLAIVLLIPLRKRLSVFHPHFSKFYAWHGGRVGVCAHDCTFDEWCRNHIEWHGPWGNVVTLDSYVPWYGQSPFWRLPGGSLEVVRYEWVNAGDGAFIHTYIKTWRSPHQPPKVEHTVEQVYWRNNHKCVVPLPR